MRRLLKMFLLIIFCFSFENEVFSQVEKSNFSNDLYVSYQKSLSNKKYDQALVNLNELSEYLNFTEIDHQRSFDIQVNFEQYLGLCRDSVEMAKYYINYAESATYIQNYLKSLKILEKGISFLENLQDSTRYEYGYAYLKAAENTNKLNYFSQSATYYQKAEKIFAYQKDTLMLLWTKSGKSRLFSSYALYDKAAEERSAIFLKGNPKIHSQVVAIAHIGAAIDAFHQRQPDQEIEHIRQALKVKDTMSDIKEIVQILTLTQATAIYARHQQKDSSNYYLNQLQKKLNGKIVQLPFINTYYRFAKGQNALINGRINEAETIAKELLSELEDTHDWQNIIKTNWLLFEIFEQKNEHQKAIEYLKKYTLIKDSVNKEASRKHFAYVQTQFEIEKKDLEISKQSQNIKLLNAKNHNTIQRFVLGGIIIVLIFVLIYIWRSKQFAQRKSNLQKQFAQNLIKHVEDERKRIAGELHDSVGQNLLLIKNSFIIQNYDNSDVEVVNQTIDEVRNISHSLHPFQFEKLGLIASIKNTVNNFQKNSTIFYSEELKDIQIGIGIEKEIVIYRMIQECLNNVEKHAKAKACIVSMRENEDEIIFSIKDNGVGFDWSKKQLLTSCLGLKTLKERAKIVGAKLYVESELGRGTNVYITVSKK